MLMMLFVRVQQNLLMLMMLLTCVQTKAADADDAFCLGSLACSLLARPESCPDYSFAVSGLRKTALLPGRPKKFGRSEKR